MKQNIPILYDAELLDRIKFYLSENHIDFQDEDEEVQLPPANKIINRLRNCGWLTQRELRGTNYITNLTPAAEKIIREFNKLSDSYNKQVMTNQFLSMQRLLTSAMVADSFEGQEPYERIIRVLYDTVLDLKQEMIELRDSVSGILKAVMRVDSINSLGAFISKDELLQKFFRDYFVLKRNGLIPAKLMDIENNLKRLRHNEFGFLDKAIDELSDIENIPKTEAKNRINNEIAVIHGFMEDEYDSEMSLIEKRINSYYNLAHVRLMLLMSSGEGTQDKIDNILHNQRHLNEQQKNELFSRLSDCIRINENDYVSKDSLKIYKKSSKDTGYVLLKKNNLSEDEIKRRAEEAVHKNSYEYSAEKTSNYFKAMSQNKDRFETGDLPVNSKYDALMYSSAVLNSASEDFDYDVEIIPGQTFENDVASISKIRLTKRKHK